MYKVHCAVIFAIAQLSFFDLTTSYLLCTSKSFLNIPHPRVQDRNKHGIENAEKTMRVVGL